MPIQNYELFQDFGPHPVGCAAVLGLTCEEFLGYLWWNIIWIMSACAPKNTQKIPNVLCSIEKRWGKLRMLLLNWVPSAAFLGTRAGVVFGLPANCHKNSNGRRNKKKSNLLKTHGLKQIPCLRNKRMMGTVYYQNFVLNLKDVLSFIIPLFINRRANIHGCDKELAVMDS